MIPWFVFNINNFYCQASLVAWTVKSLPAMQETWVLVSGLGRSPGEGNGYPIQYSGPQNSMDRGAWQATAHGFAKSLTQLNTLTSEKKKDPICANAKSFNPKY